MREYYFIRLANYTIVADGTVEDIVWRGEAVDTEDDDAVCRAYKAAMAALREVVGNALSGPLFCCQRITTIMLCGPVDAAIRDTDGEYTQNEKIIKVVKIY